MLPHTSLSSTRPRCSSQPTAVAAPATAHRQGRHFGRSRLRNVSSSAQDIEQQVDTEEQLDEVVAEAAVRAGWDPHGLLPPVEGPVDHFSRRARQRKAQQQGSGDAAEDSVQAVAAAAPTSSAYTTAVQQQRPQPQQTQQQQEQPVQQVQELSPPSPPKQQQQEQPAADAAAAAAAADAADSTGPVRVSQPPSAAFAPSDPVQRIPATWLKQGGIPASEAAAYARQVFVEKLATKFIPIDLDFPGVRIVNFDPAIFTIEGFMTPEECQQWQQAALDSGCLQQSKIGAGNAAAAADGSVNVYGARRTSSSLLMDPPTQGKSPALTALMKVMQARATKLLAHLDGGRSWGAPGRMPAGGQYCFESPQVARYTTGQHFLAHEDGFPPLLANANGFQRHATLLLYLNDVQQGGATHFDHLGVSVQPRQGMALLFFPAYANGTPDARTLHTAQDADDIKWVMQQWIARGYPTPKAVLKAVKVAALAGPEADVAAAAAAAGGEAGAPEQQAVQREVFKVVASSSSVEGYGSQPSKGKAKRGSKKGSGKGFSRR